MRNTARRICVSSNGEIYNHFELRKEPVEAGQSRRPHNDDPRRP